MLTVIFCHTNARRDTAWPSQTTIAKRARISVRQVKRLLKKLHNDGWFEAETAKRLGQGQRWKMTTYRPALPLNWRLEAGDIQVAPPSETDVVTSGAQRGDISDSTRGHLAPDVVTSRWHTNSESECRNPKLQSEYAARAESSDNDGPRAAPDRPSRDSRLFEAEALAKETGFRDRLKGEQPQSYLDAVTRHRDIPAAPEIRKRVRELMPANAHLLRRPRT